VRRLESDERFNAGRGGAVQSDGRVRVDAGVMTDRGAVGAVASLRGVVHPVTVARAVCEETPHVLLAGPPGERFAGSVGVDTDADLTTERTRERFAAADPPGPDGDHLAWTRERFGDDGDDGERGDDGVGDGERGDDADGVRGDDADHGRPPGDHDTVGAVAGDGDRFAAATSTAGRWFALSGRVGDVPQVGSGFLCSSAGGVSATGAGEDIARTTLSRLALDRLDDGRDAQSAAEAALDEFARRTGSTAGLIVLGPDGAGSAYDAPAMGTAVAER
jgi:isoaspartyl peptidase/L-asparaginase-like protein (Ntn-hydrolase superfamily)